MSDTKKPRLRHCLSCAYSTKNMECRRFPPEVNIGWPVVRATDWCGEWVSLTTRCNPESMEGRAPERDDRNA